MKKCTLVLLLACNGPLCNAQVTYSGSVADRVTGDPLPGVSVTALPGGLYSRTDQGGAFHLNISNRVDSLRLSCLGYSTETVAAKPSLHIFLSALSAGLDEVIVSADRQSQSRTDAPVAVSILSRKILDQTHATQLDQLLNQSAGVYMVDLGNQQHAMAIRQPLGYNNYFLYMEDGIPIRAEGDFNHNALIEINDAAVERIEILKGPSSSIYGSEAVGGAVNFITRAPTPAPAATVQAETGSFGYRRTNFSVSGTHKKLGIWFGGYWATRIQPDSFYDNFHKVALNFRGDYAVDAGTRISLKAAYINYYTDQKGGLDSAEFFNRNYIRSPISNQRFTYRKVYAFRSSVTLEHAWSEISKTNFTLYFRNNTIGQNPFYDEGATGSPFLYGGQINSDSFVSYGTILQQVNHFKWLDAEWINAISADYSPEDFQARFIWIRQNPEGVFYSYIGTDSMLVDYHARILNAAAYSQLTLHLSHRLKMAATMRYDRLAYIFVNRLAPGAFTGPADTSSKLDHITPKLGATFDLGKNRGLYASYSMGFAPPNITDLYSGYTVPDLRPSSFYNYEAGGWIPIRSKGYTELSVYRMDGINEIVQVIQPNGISLAENTGKTKHEGLELSLQYALVTDLQFRLAATLVHHSYTSFTDGKTNVSGNLMANAPPYIANGAISYQPAFFKPFEISLEWQSVAPYFTDPEDRHRYAGYNIFNCRTRYRIGNFELWAQCLNILDKVYATIVTFGYGQNTFYPGILRTFQIGAGYNFHRKGSIQNGR
jgi:iron complex outermembrane receptor protein